MSNELWGRTLFCKILVCASQICSSGAESWAERGWGGSPVRGAALGASAQFPASESQCPPQPIAVCAIEKLDRRQQLIPHHPKNNPLGALIASAREGKLCLRSK